MQNQLFFGRLDELYFDLAHRLLFSNSLLNMEGNGSLSGVIFLTPNFPRNPFLADG